ncbi:putative membrane-bound lytic murein transglycosylase D [Pseudomonas syringae pv. aptata]|uniref:Putative membrane-bound lytic murein transglycosylase D n=2 Tax=Pseudomonas syringae TaxID=317 RepID=A0A3M5WPX0_PSEAP|nr:putative membrane-bound lytic murein transglycosylase D [Pseudomonas syringae pv. aptata]
MAAVALHVSSPRLLARSVQIAVLALGALCVGCQSVDDSQSRLDRLPRLVAGLGHRSDDAQVDPRAVTTVSDLPVYNGEDVWQRVAQRCRLVDGQGVNERIARQRDWLLNNRGFLTGASKRATPYLHFIVERLDERNMPLELALLPMIESSYNPLANSPAAAAGLWQFIPSTGRYFNLRQTSFYDGRRDIQASTVAALDYLTRLHDMFNGDWLLALAAYNAGEGTVSRAIERNDKLNLPTDYWNLPLPQETRDYVPKLLALSQVVLSPEAYGVNLNPIANQPYFEVVELNKRVDLSKVASAADIDEDELIQLNPAYKKRLTVDGPQHLLVPTSKAQLLTASLLTMKQEELVAWQPYRVRKGDTLESLASRYQVTVSSLKGNNKLSGNRLKIGQSLSIPVKPGMQNSQPVFEALASNDKPSRTRSYKVRSGDNLTNIAQANKVDVEDLQRWNKLTGKKLKVGQTLVMQDTSKPAGKAASKAVASTGGKDSEKKSMQYKIQKGDSMYLVAKRFNVEMQHLKRWNPRSGQALKPGQTLTVYLPH